MRAVIEDHVEQASLVWFEELGYAYKCGYDIAHDGDDPERKDYRSVILPDRLKRALIKLNPDIPVATIEEAIAQIGDPNIPSLTACNRQMHQWLTKGLKVTFQQDDQTVGRQLQLIDYDEADNNDWLVVNQFTVEGLKHNRRPDIVVFVNGLPLSVIELKNPADVKADIWAAFNQLQTYKNDIPDLFNYNAALVVSDGVQARLGSLTANEERFCAGAP